MKTLSNPALKGAFSLLLGLSLLAGTTGCNNNATPPVTKTPQSQTSSLQPLELSTGMVEPGAGIKEVRLGQTRAEVEQSLGTPTGHDANEFVKGQTYLLYHTKGIELTLQDDKVEQITLHSKDKDWSAYTGGTEQGVGVTSTAKQVMEAFGPCEDEAPRALRYPARGIVFRFDVDREGDGSNARVDSLSVVASGG